MQSKIAQFLELSEAGGVRQPQAFFIIFAVNILK